MAEKLTTSPAKNYMGGEWRDSLCGETYEKRNPWRPSEITGVYPASDADDARAAVDAAAEAFPGWADLPAQQRAAFFTKAATAIEARAERVAPTTSLPKRGWRSRCRSRLFSPFHRVAPNRTLTTSSQEDFTPG